MKIVRWNPRYYRNSLMNEFDRIFEGTTNWEAPASLALDVIENDEAYVVEASVPGINPDDVEITLDDDVLTIKGEVKEEKDVEEETYRLRERRYGNYGRSIRFPVAVNADDVEATYENGVLTLNVPKAEAVKPKRIAIKAA